MVKIQIKSEKLTPFGGIFSIMEQFDALLAQTIDSTLGLRCTMFGYQYSEILRSLMCVYLCGGSCIEDVTTHLMKHLSLHPTLRTCSADTILRAIEELTFKSITYKSASGKSYDFNTADKMNCLLVNALLATGQLKSGQEYDFDFDHQFIETEKYDAKPTYKKFLGVIEIETFEDLKTAIRFLFSGIYDSQNFLIQHGSTFAKSEIVNLLERALLPIKNRYGENQDVIISMASVCQHKKDIMVLYPYGGTDFGSFMLFVV